MNNADEAGAAAVDYLMYSGYVTPGLFLGAHGRAGTAEDRRGRGGCVVL